MTMAAFPLSAGMGQGFKLGNRLHVPPRFWLEYPATDYWMMAGSADLSTASGATNIAGLDSYGWTMTSVAFTNTVTADFISSADDTPPNFNADASGDVVRSPLIFGDYAHAFAVSQLLGYVPDKLCCDFYGAFTTASANEPATLMGFHNGSANVMGIYSDAANFQLTSDNGTTKDAGLAVDNAYHLWRIKISKVAGTAEWFIDAASQGTVAITQDVWPAGFGFVASTTNRVAMSWAHVWYE